jgi:hypothetical protein
MIPSDLNLRVTETNSEGEDDNELMRLKSELQRQEILANEAL